MKYCSAREPSNVVFIMLPGNPGNSKIYIDFMRCLHLLYNQKVDVYGVNFLGHCEPSSEVFSLEDQIEYIRRQILSIKYDHPNAKIYLLCHSLGAFVGLRLESLGDKIICLFPSIDDFKSTFHARLMRPLYSTIGLQIVAFLVFLTSFVPRAVRLYLTLLLEPRFTVDQATLLSTEWDYRLIHNTLGLVRDECKFIPPLDLSKFDRMTRNDSSLNSKSSALIDKCYFIFSPFDGWCSIETFRKLTTKYPEKLITREHIRKSDEGGIYLTDAEVPHGFVLGYNEEVAKLVHKIVGM